MQTDITDLDQHARLKARLSLVEQQLLNTTYALDAERSTNRRIRAERNLYYNDLQRIIRAIERLNSTEAKIADPEPRGWTLDTGWLIVAAIAAVAAFLVVGIYLRVPR